MVFSPGASQSLKRYKKTPLRRDNGIRNKVAREILRNPSRFIAFSTRIFAAPNRPKLEQHVAVILVANFFVNAKRLSTGKRQDSINAAALRPTILTHAHHGLQIWESGSINMRPPRRIFLRVTQRQRFCKLMRQLDFPSYASLRATDGRTFRASPHAGTCSQSTRKTRRAWRCARHVFCG